MRKPHPEPLSTCREGACNAKVMVSCSAALMALSQLAPLGFLALVGYVPLIAATRNESPGRVFKLAWAATTLQYMATLYWLNIAITIFGGLNWAISLTGVFLLSAMIGCYLGGALALARYISIKLGWSYLWLFAPALAAVEYWRNYGFLASFPWGISANSLVSVPVLLQGFSLIGAYGMVAVIGLVNAGVFSLFRRTGLPAEAQAKAGEGRLAALAFVTLLALCLYGTYRIQTLDLQSMPKIKTALLQGNIEQGIKNHAPQHGDEILTRYNQLQRQAKFKDAELVIWPETAYPYRLWTEELKFMGLDALAPVNVIGVMTVDSQREYYNSAYVLNGDGSVLGHFDKNHLVPFGEYVPWPLESIVQKLVPGTGSYGRGRELKPLNLGRLSMAVTVCYEGVFPEISRAFVEQGANLLVNVTNDAWYGFSAGPYQHLAMYQMRSVETGRSYARATNTGVSAWVDPLGYLHDATPLYEEALVVSDIPLAHETTWYVRIGDIVPQLCVLLMLVAWVMARRPKTRGDWLRLILGVAIILAARGHYGPQEAVMIESAWTKETLFWMLGLVIGLRLV